MIGVSQLRCFLKTGMVYVIALGISACHVYKPVEQVAFEKPVDTYDKPVTLQVKKTWTFGSLHISNEFDCARLNELRQENDSIFFAYIRPENTPINPSPWYAFSVTEDSTRTRYIILDYGEEKHRYYPKIGRAGSFMPMDSADVTLINEHQAMIRLALSHEEVVIAAQRPVSSTSVDSWMDSVSRVHRLAYRTYAKSKQGRPLKFMRISEGKKDNPMIVLLCRQHPPEVTGWFALQYFLTEILADTELSQSFLEHYTVIVYPLLNPDGVDGGNWRHNAGGVDLNRDWEYYRQDEIRNTVGHVVKMSKGRKVLLALDFHSTYDDVYYTNDETLKPSALPGFKDQWLAALRTTLPDNHFKESYTLPQTPVSKNWFYRYFNTTSITYEIGDNTPQEIIELKGRTSAELMMRILLGELQIAND